ncbi:hypothetical protein [Pseudorhodobacter sp.]|uniref:hypothetical protein n=1 Tax=Pseudorhodobacter sp. TaxID=1934400 RepID=UPI002647B2C9|nr:hypothetical protein [Pseudorhodobacter sp.]MDN5785708.1 hypothetical protein [Pseudorhodobacter sp.]
MAFGEVSSEAAQAAFRRSILDEADCPICRNKGLMQFNLRGQPEDGGDDTLVFGLPVIVPGRLDLLSVGALIVGMCPNCGYLAHFMDSVVAARHDVTEEMKDE